MNPARTLLVFIAALLFLSKLFGGSRDHDDIAHNFETPEGVVLRLEDAYRANDIEKAVQCKNFRGEAEQVLHDKPSEVRTEEIVTETASALELAYRTEIERTGFPSMKGVTCRFTAKRELSPDTVLLTEVFHLPDGSTHTEKVHVRHTKGGWRVISAPRE